MSPHLREFLCAVALLTTTSTASAAAPAIQWARGGHSDGLLGSAWSHDGTLIATSGHFFDSTLKLWRASDRRLERTLVAGNETGAFASISFSLDDQLIADPRVEKISRHSQWTWGETIEIGSGRPLTTSLFAVPRVPPMPISLAPMEQGTKPLIPF